MTGLLEIVAVYEGSDGSATTALYLRLGKLGHIGEVALNLFRAHKASSRAKVYRGSGYRGKAYEKKQWSMENAAKALLDHADDLRIPWGWAVDPEQNFHNWVMYVDLPTGQVSFHAALRGAGPDYTGKWDGVYNAGGGRICTWVARLLQAEPADLVKDLSALPMALRIDSE